MTKPKLTYFDAPVSRGEECRLALLVAGVEFEDVRLNREAWLALKPSTPFGAVPIYEVPGHAPIAQSNAILTLIGRQHGLHPAEPFEAARHEELLCHVEDLRTTVGPTLRITDDAEKKKAREALLETFFPVWGASTEKHIGDGPFFAGAKINVVDIKLHMAVRWFAGGKVDYIPPTVFAGFPKLTRIHDSVRDHERVKGWYARA
jgi:prostaglandin-H2 D-isomerase / glutathione transferase